MSGHSCSECDFVYDVSSSGGTDYAGACGDQGGFSSTMGYASGTAYGDVLVVLYNGTYYPYMYASYSGGELAYYAYWESDGYYYTYTYDWFGEASISR